jgi:hypothetical protein
MRKEGKRGETKEIKNIFNEMIEEKFSNHEKEIAIQVQEAFRTLNR